MFESVHVLFQGDVQFVAGSILLVGVVILMVAMVIITLRKSPRRGDLVEPNSELLEAPSPPNHNSA
ncbi:MAG: hypothetical protein QNI91_17265 [Arenicellales bacterium]|nr:hypothetical protein [Arenicellales bacterium]